MIILKNIFFLKQNFYNVNLYNPDLKKLIDITNGILTYVYPVQKQSRMLLSIKTTQIMKSDRDNDAFEHRPNLIV